MVILHLLFMENLYQQTTEDSYLNIDKAWFTICSPIEFSQEGIRRDNDLKGTFYSLTLCFTDTNRVIAMLK
jgi:hypothetical protein